MLEFSTHLSFQAHQSFMDLEEMILDIWEYLQYVTVYQQKFLRFKMSQMFLQSHSQTPLSRQQTH